MGVQDTLDATKWLTSIYTSEVSFLLHLPLFITISTPDDIYSAPTPTTSPTDPGNITPFERLANITLQKLVSLWNKLKSSEYKTQQLWREKHPSPKPYFQLVIFAIRTILNFSAMVMIFWELRVDSGKTSAQIAHSVFHSRTSRYGWYFLLASLILYVVSFVHQRYHLMQIVSKSTSSNDIIIRHFPNKLYWLAHLSVLNFSLDLPGTIVKSTTLSHAIVLALNITAGILLAFCVAAIEPFKEAWGCYPNQDTYRDYNYGMCPGAFGSDQARLQPVCDQPGVRCGQENAVAQDFLNKELRTAQYIIAASMAVYVLSINPKIEYFKTVIDKAIAVQKVKKE